MKLSLLRCCLLFFFVFAPQADAGDFDFGLGLSFIESARGDGFDLGWDLQVGYEFWEHESWNAGVQLELTRGITADSKVDDENDLSYSSNAIYLTARPEDWWLHFKGGLVQADYRTLDADASNTGYGVGVGVVMGGDDFRIHLIDYQRLTFGAESFDLFTISIGVLLH